MRVVMLRALACALGLAVDLLLAALERLRRLADRAEIACVLADVERKLRARP